MKYMFCFFVYIIILVPCSYQVRAQNDDVKIERLTNQRLSKLKREGIDTIIIYKTGCVGYDHLNLKNSDCNSTETINLVYRRFGKDYLELVRDCKIYNSVQIKDKDWIDFYYQNKRYFTEQELFYKKVNESIKKEKWLLPPVPSHHCFNSLTFMDKRDSCSFYIVKDFEYDKFGKPKFLKFKWKEKQKEWVDLIDLDLKGIDSNILEKN